MLNSFSLLLSVSKNSMKQNVIAKPAYMER